MNNDNKHTHVERGKQNHQRVLPGSGDGCGAYPIPATGDAQCISAFSLHYLRGRKYFMLQCKK